MGKQAEWIPRWEQGRNTLTHLFPYSFSNLALLNKNKKASSSSIKTPHLEKGNDLQNLPISSDFPGDSEALNNRNTVPVKLSQEAT